MANVCQGSFKRLFTHFCFATIKIARNSRQHQKAIQITNPNYDIVIKRLHLYYDMKLVTFGIDEEKNSNSSISSFCTAIYTTAANPVPD